MTSKQKDKTYLTWKSMRSVCNTPSHGGYKNYGAKGIRVCKRWDDYDLFYSDMGPRPPDMYLIRTDRTKNFNKDNCQWVIRHLMLTSKFTANYHNVINTDVKLTVKEIASKYHVTENSVRKVLAKHNGVYRRPDQVHDYNGVKITPQEAATIIGLSPKTIYSYLTKGLSIQTIIDSYHYYNHKGQTVDMLALVQRINLPYMEIKKKLKQNLITTTGIIT